MKLLTFGEIIWDVYPDRATLGGAPLNFTAHAFVAGADTYLCSALGQDDLGDMALDEISRLGISHEYVVRTDKAPSGRCTVSLDENSMPTYHLDEHSAYDFITLPSLLPDECDALAFGTLALRYEENMKTLDALFTRVRPREVFADLNIRAPYYSELSVNFALSHASILKASDEDLALAVPLLFGEEYKEDTHLGALCARYPNIRLILLTKGAQGALCYRANDRSKITVDACKVEVLSTVGAGDSFGATFLVWYMKTGDILTSMQMATRVSAYVVSHKEAIPEGCEDYFKKLCLPLNPHS